MEITDLVDGQKIRLHITPKMIRDGKCARVGHCAVELAAMSKFGLQDHQVVASYDAVFLYEAEPSSISREVDRVAKLVAVNEGRHQEFTRSNDDPKEPLQEPTSFTYEVIRY